MENTSSGELKIDLGCGFDKHEGYIRADISSICKPDVLIDVRKIPWQWEDNSVDYLRVDNLFEHLVPSDFMKAMAESWRVLKVGGILWIRVPYLGWPLTEEHIIGMFTDPTHQSYFTNQTFDYWDKEHSRHSQFGVLYGCKPFNRIRQVEDGKFLIVELCKLEQS